MVTTTVNSATTRYVNANARVLVGGNDEINFK